MQNKYTLVGIDGKNVPEIDEELSKKESELYETPIERSRDVIVRDNSERDFIASYDHIEKCWTETLGIRLYDVIAWKDYTKF